MGAIDIRTNLDLPVQFANAQTAQQFAQQRYEHNMRLLQSQQGLNPQRAVEFLEDAARGAYEKIRRDAARKTRRDAADTNAGIFGSRELEHKDPVPIRELFPQLVGLNIFKADARGIKFGAKTWRAKRLQEFGEPKVFGTQGKDVPKVKLRSSEETGRVLYYVLGIEYSLFDEAAAGFANVSYVSELIAAAERRMAKFASDMTLHGSVQHELLGILNNPYFTKLSLGTTYKINGDGEAMLEGLEVIVTATTERLAGNEQLEITDLWLSPRVYVACAKTTVYPNADTKTVLEKFKERNPGVEVHKGQDLTGIGATEMQDCILAVNNSIESGSNQVVRDFTMLPLEKNSFMRSQDGFMAHAGVRSDYPVGNVVAFVNYERD